MTTILKDTDLTGATAGSVDWTTSGWETCTASEANIVIATYNYGAAYSADGGNKFQPIDANGLCAQYGKSLIGDQVITYVPTIQQFAWVMLTTDQSLVLALASPTEVEQSRGRSWETWLIPPGNFEDGRSLFDRPSISAGREFLYIAVNLGPISIAIRLSLNELQARGFVHYIYFVASGVFWLRATQNTGAVGFFSALINVRAENEQDYLTSMRVFAWPENSDPITYFDVPITAVPTEGGTVHTPSGDWLANGKGSLQVLGLTASGTDLWAAWWGNRTLQNPPPHTPTLTFPYPHIEIAVVDLSTKKLKVQLYMWNPDFAFVFPDLATNGQGEVGLAFCWGGGEHDPQFGVGVLTWPTTWPITSHISITSGPSSAAGGDYITIRQSFPTVTDFSAAGFTQMPPGPTDHPHFVAFRP